MCVIFLTPFRASKLYNPRFRARDGFFDARCRQARLKLPPAGSQLSWTKPPPASVNYARLVATPRDKLDDLACTLSKLLCCSPSKKVYVYAHSNSAKSLLRCCSLLHRLPESKAEQSLMLRRFRRSNFALLLSDSTAVHVPRPDVTVHYDLPRTLSVLYRRHAPREANIYFFHHHERVFIAHLQNALNVIVSAWELPSRDQQVDSFLSRFCTSVAAMDAPRLGVDLSGFMGDRPGHLGALLYLAHRKLAHSKKQYLLYDPGFRRFKTRKDVEAYLLDMGISNYAGITLTRKGFVVDSYDLLRLPLTQERFPERAEVQRLRRRVNRGLISSWRGRRLLLIV